MDNTYVVVVNDQDECLVSEVRVIAPSLLEAVFGVGQRLSAENIELVAVREVVEKIETVWEMGS